MKWLSPNRRIATILGPLKSLAQSSLCVMVAGVFVHYLLNLICICHAAMFLDIFCFRHSGGGSNGTPGNEKPFACPVPGCKKRYKNVNGIKYHSKNGHKKDGRLERILCCQQIEHTIIYFIFLEPIPQSA